MATVQRAKGPATTMSRTNSATAPTQGTTLSSGAIALRAYEIWKESGCPNGRDQEHWFRAERELRAKMTVR
jgi:hypothetical protein